MYVPDILLSKCLLLMLLCYQWAFLGWLVSVLSSGTVIAVFCFHHAFPKFTSDLIPCSYILGDFKSFCSRSTPTNSLCKMMIELNYLLDLIALKFNALVIKYHLYNFILIYNCKILYIIFNLHK